MYFQQGDVLLKVVKEIPKGSEKLDHMILAEGEVTGHKHQVVGDAELLMLDNTLFLSVFADDVSLLHEEHHPVKIPQGDYVIHIVQEYDHFAEEARKVAD